MTGPVARGSLLPSVSFMLPWQPCFPSHLFPKPFKYSNILVQGSNSYFVLNKFTKFEKRNIDVHSISTHIWRLWRKSLLHRDFYFIIIIYFIELYPKAKTITTTTEGWIQDRFQMVTLNESVNALQIRLLSCRLI